ncbi:MAG: hypothetical protein M0R46_02230 [Candidatus Muirbacterium halophilum]|nr:hypothetical protein [Candidatus Muirbacterium halophilum]MCK9474707.1 hypothetical protein [Candidatus Muirbacterium halophilum]
MRRILILLLIAIISLNTFCEIRVFEVNPQNTEDMSDMFSTFISDGGKIYTDIKNGKIIIEDSSENMLKYQNLYDNFSQQSNPVQIMIEARIVEVSFNQDNDYGFEWNLKKDFNNIGSTTKRFEADINVPSSQYTTGGTFKLTTLNNDDFDGILNLMMQKEDVNIISNPKLFVKDGKRADILVGKKIPIDRSVISDGIISTNTDFVEVGVKLGVKASIIGDSDIINLTISPEISSFNSWSPGANKPIIDTISANTEVMVKDKQVVAIGGLIKVDMKEIYTKVPVLGDMPFLGKLFRRKRNTKERKEIIIFLSPGIQRELKIKNERDNNIISADDEKIWHDIVNDTTEIYFE